MAEIKNGGGFGIGGGSAIRMHRRVSRTIRATKRPK